MLDRAPQVFRIAKVRVALPGLSDPTIRVMLARLKTEGRVRPEGRGRRVEAGPRHGSRPRNPDDRTDLPSHRETARLVHS